MGNGFTFGGVHSDSLGLIVNSKTIPASPPISNRLQEIGGVDGAWDYGVSYGPRELEIDVTILGDTPADTRRSVRKLVGTMNPRKGSQILIFDDEPDIMYYARISNQVPLDTLGAMGTFTLQLVCPDPFGYSTEIRTDTIARGGTLTHLGTAEAFPRLSVSHGGGSGSITNKRPDGITETLAFTADSPAGTYVIDSKQKTITVEGNRAYKYVKGDFFELPMGDSSIKTSGAISSVTVEYRDTWI